MPLCTSARAFLAELKDKSQTESRLHFPPMVFKLTRRAALAQGRCCARGHRVQCRFAGQFKDGDQAAGHPANGRLSSWSIV